MNDENLAPLPFVFGSHIKQPRNSHKHCAGCDSSPPEDQAFRQCSACKVVVYCSPECQKLNWVSHRPACKATQNLHRPPQKPGDGGDLSKDPDGSWPTDISQAQRNTIFDKFLSLHKGSFIRSISVLRCLLHLRHARDIDPDTQGVVFTLGYRANTDANPATRLFVQKVAVTHCEKGPCIVNTRLLGDVYGSGLSTGGESELGPGLAYEDDLKTDRIIGFLKIMFQGGGTQTLSTLPLERITSQYMRSYGSGCQDWLNDLRVATTAGIVVAPDGGTESAGVLEKKGKKWRWRKMSDEERVGIQRRRAMYMGPEPRVSLSLVSK